MNVSKAWVYLLFALAIIMAVLALAAFLLPLLLGGYSEGEPIMHAVAKYALTVGAVALLASAFALNGTINSMNEMLKIHNSQINFLMGRFEL